MTNPLAPLIPTPPPESGASFRWGTVTATGPLRVRVDGDTAPVDSTPATLTDCGVGDRVLLLLNRRQLIVLGTLRSV
jgi:hypothetical protein